MKPILGFDAQLKMKTNFKESIPYYYLLYPSFFCVSSFFLSFLVCLERQIALFSFLAY